jgi:hypothetical protein
MACIKPATQCESTQPVTLYCASRGIDCVSSAPWCAASYPSSPALPSAVGKAARRRAALKLQQPAALHDAAVLRGSWGERMRWQSTKGQQRQRSKLLLDSGTPEDDLLLEVQSRCSQQRSRDSIPHGEAAGVRPKVLHSERRRSLLGSYVRAVYEPPGTHVSVRVTHVLEYWLAQPLALASSLDGVGHLLQLLTQRGLGAWQLPAILRQPCESHGESASLGSSRSTSSSPNASTAARAARPGGTTRFFVGPTARRASPVRKRHTRRS